MRASTKTMPKKKRYQIVTREALLKAKVRPWLAKSTYVEIFIVPTRKKHDSGWMCMAIVGLKDDLTLERAAWCDDICWDVHGREGYMMRCDMTFPGGILHYWGAFYEVGTSLSSTDIRVTERPL